MEHARLKNIWEELDKQERELKKEQKHLSDIWLKVCEKHKKNEDDRAKLDGEKVDLRTSCRDATVRHHRHKRPKWWFGSLRGGVVGEFEK